MRNLQYEMRICQKSHNNVTKTVYVWFEFLWIRRQYSSLEAIGQSRVPMAFLWPKKGNKFNCSHQNKKMNTKIILNYCQSFRITLISSKFQNLPIHKALENMLQVFLNSYHLVTELVAPIIIICLHCAKQARNVVVLCSSQSEYHQ